MNPKRCSKDNPLVLCPSRGHCNAPGQSPGICAGNRLGVDEKEVSLMYSYALQQESPVTLVGFRGHTIPGYVLIRDDMR